jgi:hypothetical protein
LTNSALRQHRELILNYFRAQKLLSSGVVEGLNNKAQFTMANSLSRYPPTISSDDSYFLRPAFSPSSRGLVAFASRRAATSQDLDIQVFTPNRGSTHFNKTT